MMAQQRKTRIWFHYALLIVGFSMLGYCAVLVIQARQYQRWARQQIQQAGPELEKPSPVQPAEQTFQREPLVENGATPPIGRIDIPRIHVSAMVADGDSPQVLRIAVGHVPGTARPGQAGNTVLAAHRDSFFRGLGEMKRADVIRLTFPGGEYLYTVEFVAVVNPDETWVMEPAAGQALTLITCYPFHFIGPAPKRFVVRAHRVESQSNASTEARAEKQNGTDF